MVRKGSMVLCRKSVPVYLHTVCVEPVSRESYSTGYLYTKEGFRFSVLGFPVAGFRFSFPGFGFVFGFRSSGFEFRVSIFGVLASNFGFCISGFARTLTLSRDFGLRLLGFARFPIEGFAFRGLQGFWVLHFGFRKDPRILVNS